MYHPANHSSLPSRLFDLLRHLASSCNLLPSFLTRCHASPHTAFMLANLILLAIVLTSGKPKPARSSRRAPSPALRKRPPKSTPPKHRRRIFQDPEEGPCRACQHSSDVPIPSAMRPAEPVPDAGAQGFPKRDGDGGLRLPEAPANPDRTPGLSLGRERDHQEAATVEDVQEGLSNHDLDRKFDEFITTFFARVHAEMRDSRR